METTATRIFDCLYFLESSEFYIVEIKRNDLNEYATVAEKFQWLRIYKESLEVSRLSFRSMDSSEEVEERFFEEGFLKFNHLTGTYIEKYNSAQHSLTNNSKVELPSIISNCITGMLNNSVNV